jgi:IS5 family transposase
MRNLEERKRLREREAEDDVLDRKKENEELAELERKKVELERLKEERRRRDEEIRERMKLKKFIEMQEELERKQHESEQQAAVLRLLAEQ